MTQQPGDEWGAASVFVVTTPAGLEAEARRELCRLLPGSEASSLLLKGNLLLKLAELDEDKVVALIEEADTEYVSQVIPVQRRVARVSDETCFARIASTACHIGRIAEGDRFIVRCRRRGRHEWQSRDLERRVAGDIARFTGGVGEYEGDVEWFVAIEIYQDTAYIGVNPPANILRKKLRRHRKYAPGKRPLNRAESKMREALKAFRIWLGPSARVLDLGAAPGGWTKVLAEYGSCIFAVDPANLDPAVSSLKNVRHLRCRADQLEKCRDLQGPFDLLTCDMNLDPQESSAIMCRLAPFLRPGAPALMTIKYVTQYRRRLEREAKSILSNEYECIRIKKLPHNARETTAAMRRRLLKGP